MIKRMLIILISGVLLEALVLWGCDHFHPWGLNSIDWTNKREWIIFFSGFFSACWLVLWGKFVTRFFFKTKVSQQAVNTTTPTTNLPPRPTQQRPPAMTTGQNNNVQPAAAPTTVATPPLSQPARMTQQAPMVAATPTPATAPRPTENNTASQKNNDINFLANIDTDKHLDLDMMAFKHVALEGKMIDLVYSSDFVAVLCKPLSEEHTWTVDTTQPIESCTWTDETGKTLQPCLDLLTQAAVLEKMEPDATIVPTLILMRGKIQNYQQVQDYLLQNEIRLVKYEVGDEPQAQLLEDLLQEKFSLFPSEEGFEDIPEEDIEDEEELEQEEENEQEENSEQTLTENPT